MTKLESIDTNSMSFGQILVAIVTDRLHSVLLYTDDVVTEPSFDRGSLRMQKGALS